MLSRMQVTSAVSLLLCLSTFSAAACDNYPLSEDQRKYLDELSLTLEIPKGSFADYVPTKAHDRQPTKSRRECWISDDFNDDGVDDFAGIYEYTGDKIRVSGWKLDLLVLYSDAGQLRHIVFPFAGRVSKEGNELRQHLGVQAAGRVDLEPGSLTLRHPAIVSYRDGQPAVIYFWNDKEFSTRTFYIDD